MRPMSFAPGKAIGETAAKAVGLARAVDWRRAAKVASKIAEALPAPGDGPLRLAIKTIGLVERAREALDRGPWREACAATGGAGGSIHEGASALVRLAVEAADGRPGWPIASRRTVGEAGETLIEYRHPTRGRAWLLTWDRTGGRLFPDAWLGPGLAPRDFAVEVWANHGGRMRLDVTHSPGESFSRPVLGAAEGLSGELYASGAERLAEVLAEQRLADARGEGRVYLLAGPPGTGKSTLAAKLAAGATLLVVGGSALEEIGLESLTWVERALAPRVVLLDDVDRSLPADLAPLLAWLSSRGGRPGAVVLTANGALPEALTRECRVDEIVLTEAPGPAERAAVLRALCDQMGVPAGLDLSAVVEATEGRGEAALVDAARRLRDRPVERVVEQIRRRRAIERAGS